MSPLPAGMTQHLRVNVGPSGLPLGIPLPGGNAVLCEPDTVVKYCGNMENETLERLQHDDRFPKLKLCLNGYVHIKYIKGSELRQVLDRAIISRKLATMWIYQLYNMVSEMHLFSVAHMDISQENIIVDSDNRLRLIDFTQSIADPSTLFRCSTHDTVKMVTAYEIDYYAVFKVACAIHCRAVRVQIFKGEPSSDKCILEIY